MRPLAEPKARSIPIRSGANAAKNKTIDVGAARLDDATASKER
jgi:hypothetical protein